MSPIPDFIDGYHLPPGEHECSFDEIEQRFVNNPQRQKVWSDYKRLYDRLSSLGLNPKSVLIDGSFVTGREQPGDVDFGALFPPSVVKQALSNVQDSHDKEAIMMFNNPNNQIVIRNLFGAHMLVAPNEFGLRQISKLFRTGGDQFGKLRDRDPKRDPDWVIIPKEKGILRVNL
ncbi:hypothetical protein KDJ56_19390 [Brevibacillus composti]|uniref:Uncharacterized protein n=1 Tax=Brevibacillus composti TaxID=2796470 RepID=A0A7T5EJY9_9BACL|nr:hypothetical protein [Brevibacillus composti]QQE74004.1 hypothetical protein JD108_19455 [Brevibacillus composti]QUO41088.1 hypothetical protein KDJ56_19390 [Brevibacillus composti]